MCQYPAAAPDAAAAERGRPSDVVKPSASSACEGHATLIYRAVMRSPATTPLMSASTVLSSVRILDDLERPREVILCAVDGNLFLDVAGRRIQSP
jgi:hypothetical protein